MRENLVDVLKKRRKEALVAFIRKEELLRTDLAARTFGYHLEYLNANEIEDVLHRLATSDDLAQGWHSLDQIYCTRARRDTLRK